MYIFLIRRAEIVMVDEEKRPNNNGFRYRLIFYLFTQKIISLLTRVHNIFIHSAVGINLAFSLSSLVYFREKFVDVSTTINLKRFNSIKTQQTRSKIYQNLFVIIASRRIIVPKSYDNVNFHDLFVQQPLEIKFIQLWFI